MREHTAIAIQIPPQWEAQVDSAALQQAVETVWQAEGMVGKAAISLVIVGDEEMSRLHEQYRAEAGTTDVLTFPYEQDYDYGEMEGYLGDIVLCFEQAQRQGGTEGHEVQEELLLLTVHGMLHLLGYDDETPSAKLEMWQRQRIIMGELGMRHVAPQCLPSSSGTI